MSSNSLTISVFGAGSIGCYLGGQLAHARADVIFVGRERYHRSLSEHGLTLTHFARDTITIGPADIDYRITPNDIASSDVVLVTVKSHDTDEAGMILKNVLNPNTLVVSFQNGVGNADRLRQTMPGFKVLAAMVPFNVTGTGSGKFHCGTEGDLCIEADDSSTLGALQKCFQQSGQGCLFSDDIDGVQWGKLLINLNNALNTLTGSTLIAGLVQNDYRQALALMIEEALLVTETAGIKSGGFGNQSLSKMIEMLRLPDKQYIESMSGVVKIDENARSSMLDDLEAGRATEVNYLQGEIVSLAKKTGQTAPINETVMHSVLDTFARGTSPNMSGAEILSLLEG